MGSPDSSVCKESTCSTGDPSLLPGSVRSEEGIGYNAVFLDFPCGSAGKESTCSVGDLDSIPRLGIPPGEGKGILIIMYLGMDLFRFILFMTLCFLEMGGCFLLRNECLFSFLSFLSFYFFK